MSMVPFSVIISNGYVFSNLTLPNGDPVLPSSDKTLAYVS